MIIDVNFIERLGNITIWVGGTFALVFLVLAGYLAAGMGVRVSPTGLESLHLHDTYYVTSSPPQVFPALFALLTAILFISSGFTFRSQAASMQEVAAQLNVTEIEE